MQITLDRNALNTLELAILNALMDVTVLYQSTVISVLRTLLVIMPPTTTLAVYAQETGLEMTVASQVYNVTQVALCVSDQRNTNAPPVIWDLH